jgi:polysaccharide pyruvyl transferase WcaK-like protein
MNIEIKGVNFTNKGAELMLHAVLQQLAAWQNEKIIAAVGLKGGSFRQRRERGLSHLAWVDSRKLFFIGPVLNSALWLVPPALRRWWGWIRLAEIEAILDASGFAYSDQFGPVYPEMMLTYYRRAKQAGQKVVLLPQAFGPFTDARVAGAMKQIVQLADLVYARDSVSYEHLVGLNGRLPHIKTAPDFTNLVKPKSPENNAIWHNQPCIIPNQRMLAKTAADVQASYIPFLTNIIEYLQAKGLRPFLLVHETRADLAVCQAIAAGVETAVPIVREPDALKIKGIIGQSLVTVSSRYHGLISGLAQGVPVLATGWSHKYQKLLEDYNCPEYLVSPLTFTSDIASLIDSMIEEPGRTQLITRLNNANERLQMSTGAMWADVKTILFSDK